MEEDNEFAFDDDNIFSGTKIREVTTLRDDKYEAKIDEPLV
jgi:hypothetical protein